MEALFTKLMSMRLRSMSDVDFLGFRSHDGNPAGVQIVDKYNNTSNLGFNDQWSRDKKNWSDYSLSTVLELSGADDIVDMKDYNERFASTANAGHHKRFLMSGQIDADGNVATLLRPNGRVMTMPLISQILPPRRSHVLQP